MIRVLIIVGGSWGIIFVIETIYKKIFPSYDQIILETVQADEDLQENLLGNTEELKKKNSNDISFY